MQTRFLLGPAGSGKTFRCLAEIRSELRASPDGPPLILLAPKQATFQLERQLLASDELAGYTRLRILSFERLAEFVLDELHRPPGPLLNDEGRVMVLRALLERHKDELHLFRATARLPGFAQQLSALLREFQRFHLDPDRLDQLAEKVGPARRLDYKLRDVALLLRAYRVWLREHELQDADILLDLAAEAVVQGSRFKVQGSKPSGSRIATRGHVPTQATLDFGPDDSSLLTPHSSLHFSGLWLDGFAEMTAQEVSLLAAVIPSCERATLAFCIEQEPMADVSWLSTWSVVSQTYRKCRSALEALPGNEVWVEVMERDPERGRFADSPALQHLEEHWTKPQPFTIDDLRLTNSPEPGASTPYASPLTPHASGLRLVSCDNPEAEAIFAAREIVRSVRDEGLRYRDVAVLVRSLDGYEDALRRVFARYDIPFFLDRRESASHHPLAELTRSALRTVAFNWPHNDWFTALKTGLVGAGDEEIDRLENESLARGWSGDAWRKSLVIADNVPLAERLEKIRLRALPPFEKLLAELAARGFKPTGSQLAKSIRELWANLDVEETLETWSESGTTVHRTVLEQMRAWLENLGHAFPAEEMPLRDWLPILEAGLANLSVGVIPPALDQVLIGTIDRSRNPDLQLVLLSGVNEGVFPAPPGAHTLLTDADRDALSERGVDLGLSRLQQVGHERYYGYIACTRSWRRLIVSHAKRDAAGKALNPSPFVDHVRRLFPNLETEEINTAGDWTNAGHLCEVMAPLLRPEAGLREEKILSWLDRLPELQPVANELSRLRAYRADDVLSPALAESLYGPELRTSVSRLEQFAACPFQFFVRSGLRAKERKRFEVDERERGSFQHEVLAEFHKAARDQGKEWRDLTPDEANELIGRIGAELSAGFKEGLFQSTDQSLFTARSLTGALQKFIRVLIEWMTAYQFDPAKVELGFGGAGGTLPGWKLELTGGQLMVFEGKIDRVDVVRNVAPDGSAWCVVMDYKSSARSIDPLLLEHGIQIQLPAYLAALSQLPEAWPLLNAGRLIPAGVFYVSLRGDYKRGRTRREVLGEVEEVRRAAFQHQGRFRLDALPWLDATGGSGQFKYRLTKAGQPYKNSTNVMDAGTFTQMLRDVEARLREMGRRIFAGDIRVDPYRKGSEVACDRCDYRSVCRIDPWTHPFRVLRPAREDVARELPEQARALNP